VVDLLAARTPKLREAVRDAKEAGHAYVIVDGTLIPIDRVAVDRPFYSGKHKKHGMNLQVIASPDGGILRVSAALPGSVHDKKAEWIWGVLAELGRAGLVTLAGKGYQAAPGRGSPAGGRASQNPGKTPTAPTRGFATRRAGKRAAQDMGDSPRAPLLPAQANSPRQSASCRPERHNHV
jgi:hypothetical protein